MLRKLALSLLAFGFLSVPLFADGVTQFTFLGKGLGNIGSTDVFTAGSLSLTATGYSAPLTTENLFAKNAPPDGGSPETGLGLANGVEHEISGTGFIQLNLSKIFAAMPASVSLSLTSLQGADAYSVWGSNTAGQLGTLLAANQKGVTFTLPKDFDFIAITSPGGSVLLDDVDVNIAEPGTAALLLAGLALCALLACKYK